MSAILTINGGSSSIKFALFTPGESRRHAWGEFERVGHPGGQRRIHEPGLEPVTGHVGQLTFTDATTQLIDWLRHRGTLESIVAIGHRVVYGGERYMNTTPVSDELLAELNRLSVLDPAHLPGEIAIIETFRRRCPHVPAFACFDTAFHRDLPTAARLLPVPRRYAAQGIRRYGFHGLSYSWLMEELARVAGTDAARGRVILAHLGAGCSLAAVKSGRCIETTMGFTPTSGVVMATRSGDLDPGFLFHVLRTEGLSVDELDDMVNRQSGLLGLSETSHDVRDLLARELEDHRAAEALDVFCGQIRKAIGACAAALGGVETLVFSAGIGENSAEIRERICRGLDFFGIRIDPERNASNAAVISTDDARVTTRVIPTDEESMIAREVTRMITRT